MSEVNDGSTGLMSITAARADDLPAIMDLERAGFPADEQWSERSWSGELVADRRRILVARAHHLLGVISLALTDRSADLHRLVVAPAARRTGVASALVHAGVEAVKHAGARSVLLEVRADNDPAVFLYNKLGFEQLAARPNYYGPGQPALIMKLWDLQGPPQRPDRPPLNVEPNVEEVA